MNKKRQKFVYLILVLLILIVVAIIGGLAMVLFSMKTPAPVLSEKIPAKILTNTVVHTPASSEKYIDVTEPQKPQAPKEHPKSVAAVTPNVCDGYGPQIKSRDAFKHKATYSASVQPSHIRFTIYIPDKSQPEGAQ